MAAARILRDLVQPPEGTATVDLPGGRRVFDAAGSDPDAVERALRARDRAMLVVPAGVKVHLALGYADMRKGMDGLAMLVRETLKKNPFLDQC
jgi:hypothetical protein